MSDVQAFIGSWREEMKAGYDEMATGLGIWILSFCFKKCQ